MTRTKKHILWIFVLFLVIGGAGYAFVFMDNVQKAKEKVQTVVVSRATIEDSILAQGTLEPRDYVDVGVQVSGQIKKLYVDIGDFVSLGQLLAELDPRSYESLVQSNEAQIKALEAQIKQENAQAAYDLLQFERARKLIKKHAVSQEDLETKEKALRVSEATLEALEAEKEQAQANLESNIINLGYTKIYSPMSGIVSDCKANEGQTLNANQTTPTILQIANLDVMTIRAEIAEADVMRLKAGMETTFSTLGALDRKWKGTIRQILPTPEVVSDVVLYNALIDVKNKDGDLMNGMSTQNNFIVARAVDALVVPTRALGVRLEEKDTEQGKVYLVYVLENNKPVARNVFVGLMTRAWSEIVSGLEEGEIVVISGAPATPEKDKGPHIPGMGRL